MRRLPLLLIVAAAFGEGDLGAEIELFVAAIRQDAGSAPLTSRIDPDGLVEEIGKLGISTEGFKETLTNKPGVLHHLDTKFPPNTIRLRRTEAVPGGAIAVVDFRNEDGRFRIRLFLGRRDGAWRIRDLDVPDIGLRLSTMIGLAVQAYVRDGTGSAGLDAVSAAVPALREGDHRRVRELLEKRPPDLPEPMEGVRLTFLALASVAASDFPDALRLLEELEQTHADVPLASFLRAQCLLELNRPEEALAAALRYAGVMGDSADVSELKGEALKALGRAEEAANAYRAGLREDPDYLGNLYGLLSAHPAEKPEEIVRYLRATTDAAAAFRDIGWDLGEAEDWAALRTLVAAQRTIDPGNAWLAYFDALLLRADNRPLEALARIEAALARVTEDRDFFADLHADIAVGCGRALEAYEAVPLSFDLLASRLSADGDAETLAALVARRAEDGTADAALRLWTIEIAWLEERHLDVVGLSTIHADAIRAERAEDTWPLDDRWIRSLVKLRREEEALARARVLDDAGDAYHLLLVRVAFDRAAEAIRAFEKCVGQGYEPGNLYADDSLAALARDEAYAPLRARYPVPEDDE